MERIIRRSTIPRFAPPRVEECPHVECGLRRIVSRLAPDGAGVPGQTSLAEAPGSCPLLDVCDTTVHVVSLRGERADRTGRQARALGTALTRTRTLVPGWKIETFAKCDRPPVGVPQAEVRVYQRPDGRGVCGTRPLRPSDERQPGRAAERKVCGSTQGVRETGNHSPTPSVQCVRRAVGRLFRSREDGPHTGAGVADENERRRGCAICERRYPVVRCDVECAPARESFGFDGSQDGLEIVHVQRFAVIWLLHSVAEGTLDSETATRDISTTEISSEASIESSIRLFYFGTYPST